MTRAEQAFLGEIRKLLLTSILNNPRSLTAMAGNVTFYDYHINYMFSKDCWQVRIVKLNFQEYNMDGSRDILKTLHMKKQFKSASEAMQFFKEQQAALEDLQLLQDAE